MLCASSEVLRLAVAVTNSVNPPIELAVKTLTLATVEPTAMELFPLPFYLPSFVLLPHQPQLVVVMMM